MRKTFRTGPLLAAIVMCLTPGRLGAQPAPEAPPLARVGDTVVVEADLLPSIGGQLLQLRNQEYDLKIRALQSVVSQRLLEMAARKDGKTPEAYLAEEVDRQVPAPSDREIEAFYLAQRERINRPLGEVKEQVRAALTQAQRAQARQEYLERLRNDPSVSIRLDRPRVDVQADSTRVRGNPSAPVTIVEFSDFQCPYCREMQQVLSGLLEKYKGKVRLGFRDFPLRPIHPNAQQAAEAARCAGEQGRFWEYHDLLFQDQSRLDPDGLKARAVALGLDAGRFGGCLAGGRFSPLIENDLRAGTAAGVSATPTFYVNGVLVVGGQNAAVFERLIEAELRARSAAGTAP